MKSISLIKWFNLIQFEIVITMDEYGDDMLDSNLDAYETYEEYLDDQMVPQDLFYLEDRDLARQLIEVGYHGKSEVLTH